MGVSRPPLVVTADPVLALSPSQLGAVNGAELLETLRRMEETGPEDAGVGPPEAEERPAADGAAAPERMVVAGHRLGIVIRDWNDGNHYKQRIAAVADRFARAGWEVILIPFHYPADVQACKEVTWLMQEPSLLVRNRQTVGALFGLLGKLDLVLAMRLHAIVMASVMRVPCVGISYDPKVERFLELTGQPNSGGVAGLEEEHLYEVMLDAWERRQEIVAHLDRVLPHLRQQAWETASLTLSVFYARSPGKRRDLGRSSGRSPGEVLRGSTAGKSRNLKQ